MSTLQDYYSVHESQRSSDSRSYHSRVDCCVGEMIPPHERQPGRGDGLDYLLCEECMRMIVMRPGPVHLVSRQLKANRGSPRRPARWRAILRLDGAASSLQPPGDSR
jgi:hypothetical protein